MEGKKLPEATHIVGFINNTQPRTTHKLPNCIFEEHEGNRVLVCTIASIDVGKDLLIDYNLNRIYRNIVTMGVVCIPFYQVSN